MMNLNEAQAKVMKAAYRTEKHINSGSFIKPKEAQFFLGGGFIRDSLLGKPTNDMDFFTNDSTRYSQFGALLRIAGAENNKTFPTLEEYPEGIGTGTMEFSVSKYILDGQAIDVILVYNIDPSRPIPEECFGISLCTARWDIINKRMIVPNRFQRDAKLQRHRVI